MGGGTEFEIEYVRLHPYYDYQDADFDIAFIKLTTPVIFSKTMQAITLPALGESVEDSTPCNVTGWGHEETDDPNWNPSVLRLVTVPIVNRDICNDTVSGITTAMICAGYEAGGRFFQYCKLLYFKYQVFLL